MRNEWFEENIIRKIEWLSELNGILSELEEILTILWPVKVLGLFLDGILILIGGNCILEMGL